MATARSQVHLQLVGERFSPHDVIVSITAAEDLTDSALTSACSTHSATASISSSTSSLRNRRLADIAETAEENQVAEKFDIQKFAVVEVSKKEDTVLGPTVVITTPDPAASSTDQPLSSLSPRQGDPSQELIHSSLGLAPEQRRGSSSSDNTRPPITDIYGSLYTPKVKLAPRLSVDTLKRPHTANSNNSVFGSSYEDLRPVAPVPKSVHIRKSKDRANSVTSDTASGPAVSSPVEPPPVDHPGEAISVAAPEFGAALGPLAPSAPPPLTPEKQRLMRALQLRKNTMKHEGENSTETNISANVATEEVSALAGAVSIAEVEAKKQEVGDKVEQEVEEKVCEQDLENAKVRGSDNENDSDAGSVISVEIAVAQPRPVSTQFPRGSVTALSIPSPVSQRLSMSEKPEEVKLSVVPIVLTKPNQKEPAVTSDDPVVETARSVSAPFLSNARRERGSVAVPRTVTVSSGSVFQRIKQLEMLNRDAPAQPAPLRSPSVQVRTVTPPAIINVKKKAAIAKANSPASSPLERTPSNQSLHTPAVIHQQPIQVIPPIPPKSDFRSKSPDYRSISLQVTTKIPRKTDRAVQTDAISPAQLLEGTITTPIEVTPQGTAANQDKGFDPSTSTQCSLEASPTSKGQKPADNATSVKAKGTFRDKAATLLHKLNIELETLPPLPTSPVASPKSISPVEPSPPSGRPKSLFGRDKEKSAEKKQKKAEKEKERERGREREREKEERDGNGSPKTEKKSLLRRMSSLTRIVREPTPAPAPAPAVEAPAKTTLHAAWVNVQLPDTMLWKRRCIKVDSTGWIFLGDEAAPGTRKYHIPSEIRLVRIPDPDEQELRFSIQLDLHEGGILQCACQSSVEQSDLLAGMFHVLVEE